MITVLTHNGKSPDQGGIRRGYQAGNRVFLFGGPREGFLLGAPVAAPPTKEARFVAWSDDVRCPHCDRMNYDVFHAGTVNCKSCTMQFTAVR